MNLKKFSFFTCCTFLLFLLLSGIFPYTGFAQEKPPHDKSTQPWAPILAVMLDDMPPPFYMVPGSTYHLSLQCKANERPFYWGVWMDVNGDGEFDPEAEQLYRSGLTYEPFQRVAITIPDNWKQPATVLRVITSDEPIYRVMHPNGHFDFEDIQGLVPFSSQIDVDVDNKTGDNCVSKLPNSQGFTELDILLSIPVDLIPSQFNYLSVVIYGYGLYHQPLVFANNASTVQLGPMSVPLDRDARIDLSIPLRIQPSTIDSGPFVGLHECEVLIFMEVRAAVNLGQEPQVFTVSTDDGEVPSIEHLFVKICECSLSDPQLRSAAPPLESLDLHLHPNPVTDELRLMYQAPATGTFRIWNGQGQLLEQFPFQAGSGGVKKAVAHLPQGLYLLEMQVGGQTKMLKFVKK